MSTRRLSLAALAAATLAATSHVHAGPLTPPPGPPASAFRTLDQVEPRAILNDVPGAGFDQHTITQPGSYYLTGDIDAAASVAVNVTVPGVTIDLNGFAINANSSGIRMTAPSGALTIRNGSIRGASGTAVDVTSPASARVIAEDLLVEDCGAGIELGAGGAARRCVIIGNGSTGLTIEAFGSATVLDTTIENGGGMALGSFALVDGVRASAITTTAISVSNTSLVSRTIVFGAEGDGIRGGDRVAVVSSFARSATSAGIRLGVQGLVRDCSAWSSGLDGIDAGSGSRVEYSTSRDNGLDGIDVDSSSIVRGCSSTNNARDGLDASSLCVIDRNVVSGNGRYGLDAGSASSITNNTVSFNDDDGIRVTNGVIVRSNIAQSNGLLNITAAGIRVRIASDGSLVDSNVVQTNPIGIAVENAADPIVVRNVANANTTDYSGVDQPVVGPLDLATASPWANISN